MNLTKSQVREDLKDIRYYYSRKKIFDNASDCQLSENGVIHKLDIYNKAVSKAPPRLYDLYISLYLKNQTQDSLSESWGYSVQHISRLNMELIAFLTKEFEKEDYKDVQY